MRDVLIAHAMVVTGHTEAKGDSHLDLDPTNSSDADFLTREKAALGADADFFTSADDNLHASGTIQDEDEEDLLGGGDATGGGNGGGQTGMSDFHSSFPAIDSGNSVSPGYYSVPGELPLLSLDG